MSTDKQIMKKNVLIRTLAVVCTLLILIVLAVAFAYLPYDGKNSRSDKTWLCLGDSITLGETNHDMSYADYAGKLTGVHLIKCGYSGYTTEMLIEKLDSLENENVTVVTVLIGTNDWVYNVPIGDEQDEVSGTFCGSMNRLMEKVKQLYPKADIYFLTPIYRNMQYHPAISFTGTVNSNGDTIDDFREAVIKCAERHDVAILDTYIESGINDKNIKDYTTDGTHPNLIGQMRLTRSVMSILK